MYAGLDALPGALRARIDGLHTINHMENHLSYTEADRRRHPGGACHPMVRTHPETGRKSLYFHVTKSQRIEGMADDEVRPLLETLLDHAVRPEWVYKHDWRPGDIAIVDNRAAVHRAEHDYPEGERRELWRVILEGDRPI